MKERKRKITIITIIGIMLILAITTFTYAIWSRTHTQTGINKNTYACFEISYAETNGQGITMDNGFPQKDEQGMQNDAYEVQITNTCDTVSTYNVILNKQTGSTLADSHLKVAVDNDYKLLSDATPTDTRQIDNFNNTASYIIGTGVVGPKQTKTVQIRSWMDEKTSEQDGENKSFTFKITIENVAGINTEATNAILGLSGEPVDKNQVVAYEDTIDNDNLNSFYVNSICPDLGDVGYVSLDYEFDTYNGKYRLKNPIEVEDYSGYDGYYVFDIDNYGIYKIENSETTYEEPDGMCSKVTKVTEHRVPKSNENYISSIILVQDEKGPTYVYNGSPNNYIKFANQIWRIVRINGDGTIRIVLNDKLKDNKVFNTYGESSNRQKYVGFTYENGTSCTKSNPCITTYDKGTNSFTNNRGTNSTIKTTLEDWYKENLAKYDEKIAESNFCNDTTINNTDNGYTYYSTYNRTYTENTPDLTCPDTTETYGGYYKTKIGLLTTDEMMLAGISYYGNAPESHYLYHSYWWWTMSPRYSNSSGAVEFGGINGFISDGSVGRVSNADGVLPVINLNADTQITSGDGSQNNPFIVG